MADLQAPSKIVDAPGLDALAVPSGRFEQFPRFAALAAEHPALLQQLRGGFFGPGAEAARAQYSDGEVLRLAAALYAHDDLRAQVIAVNRAGGRHLLELGPIADELYDR